MDLSNILSTVALNGGSLSGADQHVSLLKLLCPSFIVGSIIGKGGSVVNELTRLTGAKVRASQVDELFPTTQDRTLAVSGSEDSIIAAVIEIAKKMIIQVILD